MNKYTESHLTSIVNIQISKCLPERTPSGLFEIQGIIIYVNVLYMHYMFDKHLCHNLWFHGMQDSLNYPYFGRFICKTRYFL